MQIGLFILVGLGFWPHFTMADEASNSGAELYQTHCLSCHQFDGGGVPMQQPELINGYYTMGPTGELIQFVLEGTASRENWDSEWQNRMPAFDFLDDKQLSTVLTYIRNNFSNKGSAISEADVKNIRDK